MNLTYGLNLEFGHNSLLTLGIVTPVTGPLPVQLRDPGPVQLPLRPQCAAGRAAGDLGVGRGVRSHDEWSLCKLRRLLKSEDTRSCLVLKFRISLICNYPTTE